MDLIQVATSLKNTHHLLKKCLEFYDIWGKQCILIVCNQLWGLRYKKQAILSEKIEGWQIWSYKNKWITKETKFAKIIYLHGYAYMTCWTLSVAKK